MGLRDDRDKVHVRDDASDASVGVDVEEASTKPACPIPVPTDNCHTPSFYGQDQTVLDDVVV